MRLTLVFHFLGGSSSSIGGGEFTRGFGTETEATGEAGTRAVGTIMGGEQGPVMGDATGSIGTTLILGV